MNGNGPETDNPLAKYLVADLGPCVGHGEPKAPTFLELRYPPKDGEDRLAFPYSSIRNIQFLPCVPQPGRDAIRITFTDYKLAIIGKRLRAVFDALLQGQVAWLQVADELAATDTQPVILIVGKPPDTANLSL